MNENEKNIETCLAESVLAEVANVPTDAQFRSLVDEALDPLKQQALQQAGSDAYEKDVWTHKPYTFASSVRQMKSNLILLLRRLWRFPFGRGTSLSDAGSSAAASSAAASSTSDAAPLPSQSAAASLADAAPLRSLADMWQHYIHRLSGNSEYGIPSRLSQLTDLPSAPALLSDRRIGNGNATNDGIADGMSLAHLLCSANRDSVKKIADDNYEWVMDRALPTFPNVEEISLNCVECNAKVADGLQHLKVVNLASLKKAASDLVVNSSAEEIDVSNLEQFHGSGINGVIVGNCNVKRLYIPKITSAVNRDNGYVGAYDNNSVSIAGVGVEEVISGICKIADLGSTYSNNFCRDAFPTMKKLVLGKVTQFTCVFGTTSTNPVNLIHLEIGQDTAISLNLQYWIPTNALDASRMDLIEEGSTAQNNLQQFLSNFRNYIAERLTDQGSGKTLTLSQAVFSAIWDANGNPQVLGDGLDQLRADIHNIVRTEKHWNVNKA